MKRAVRSHPARILLYGFGPYRQFRDNITARIINSLPRQAGLRKIVFPVRFSRSQFVDALNRHKPDIVLGLGQSSRRRIEVESRARNRQRARKNSKPHPIFTAGPKSLATTLAIQTGRWAGKSNNAGDYVCNYSMYVMLAEIARRDMRVRFGFIHIPYDYDDQSAHRFVLSVLKQHSGRAAQRSVKRLNGRKLSRQPS